MNKTRALMVTGNTAAAVREMRHERNCMDAAPRSEDYSAYMTVRTQSDPQVQVRLPMEICKRYGQGNTIEPYGFIGYAPEKLWVFRYQLYLRGKIIVEKEVPRYLLLKNWWIIFQFVLD